MTVRKPVRRPACLPARMSWRRYGRTAPHRSRSKCIKQKRRSLSPSFLCWFLMEKLRSRCGKLRRRA
ncbi:hypothetical protein AD948_00920 [Acetobacter senegalensis]|uniref:Uncharacterized protein n=1 Tax=Acetobacter senegalensis TaxID=446692 RepID=A0A149U8A0_9PROT|nr:hypothetical protein AD944_05385 [Acetobacter tropicalis]KXV61654.1 hypothetical protein AD948_00920 [Acetobacter senegalensis]